MTALLYRWGLALALTLGPLVLATGATPHVTWAQSPLGAPVINLAHLDFLHAAVPYPATPPPGHSTTEPGTPLDAWWVYANYVAATGTYSPTGGGTYYPMTNTYGQGAFDTDDVARAAVVYLTHFRDYGDQHSLQLARGALRFVLYMQTTSGPNAGNFVLWMQPDGTLNPTPTPPDAPNPADAGPSYWMARSIWALGAGYATFRRQDPAFARVLSQRMHLALSTLARELVTPRYGTYYTIHGYHTPKWLIADGTDASSEALLGLTAYVAASGDRQARVLADELGNGIAGFQLGSSRDWPWQALMPWALSVSDWHAWAAHMVMALAQAGALLGRPAWVAAAQRDAAAFDTHLAASFGPINGLDPAPNDLSQIAYGAETTADGLLALGQATGQPVYKRLAGLAAAWFLGNNRAGAMMYQPSTGVVYDGINADGSINHNSGAESTIEGLLALMNAVNDPTAAAFVGFDRVVSQTTYQKVEAESGVLQGAAQVVTPPSAWTGEAAWSNGAYVEMATGGSDRITVTVPLAGAYRVFLVFDKQIAPAGAVGVEVRVDGAPVGTDDEGGAGTQGDSPNPDYLWIDTVGAPRLLQAGPHSVTLSYRGAGTVQARVDAILVQPVVENIVLADDRGTTLALYRSFADTTAQSALPAVRPPRRWVVAVYDRQGSLVTAYGVHPRPGAPGRVLVLSYGFTLATGR